MQFYVALLWNTDDPTASAAAHRMRDRLLAACLDWHCVLDESGICVSSNAAAVPTSRGNENAYRLANGEGVVLGTLFPRPHTETAEMTTFPPPQVRFDVEESRRVVASGGRRLIANYWGAYVAFLRSAQTGARWVLRDPTGAVPCQHTRIDGIDIYFVRITDVQQLADVPCTVNLSFLRSYLLLTTISVRSTGIREVETILPGERVEHSGTTLTRTFLWNPLTIASESPITDMSVAITRTRQTVLSCTHAWASRFDGILLDLSGGLDSSILASCLAEAPSRPNVHCRNFYASNPNSDERRYARLVAARARLPLSEETTDPAYDLTPLTRLPRSLIPAGTLVDIDYWSAETARQRAQGRSAIFSGDGGDELFHRGGPLPGAVDHAWTYGITRDLLNVALDDSVLDHVSVWRTFRAAYEYGVRKRPWDMRQVLSRTRPALIAEEFHRSAVYDEDVWHPLFRSPGHVAPGKLIQAFLICHGSSACYVPTMGADALAYIAPIKSQPFMELSLRIPNWLLRMGGRDRSIARHAFAPMLPAEVVNRRSKAFADSQIRTVLEHNIRLVRDMLLDGWLVRHGILDRRRLEAVLTGKLTTIKGDFNEVSRYFTVEAWWQRWAA